MKKSRLMSAAYACLITLSVHVGTRFRTNIERLVRAMAINRLVSASIIASLLTVSGTSSAQLVEYRYQGFVSEVSTPLEGGGVAVGDAVTGSFFIETNATNESPFGNGTLISYGTSSLVLYIGDSYSVSAPAGYIYLFRDLTYGSRIQIDFTSGFGLSGDSVNSTWVPEYFSSQYYLNGTPFTSTSVPAVFDVSDPWYSYLRFNVDDSVAYTFNTTSISAVPVPPAIWLFGSGLLGLIGMAKRRVA